MNWPALIRGITELLQALFVGDPMPPPPKDTPLYLLAKASLGKDIALTQHELGCAEALSWLLTHVHTPAFPPKGFLSTADLYQWLLKHSKKVDTPKPGDIIISPTGTSSIPGTHGHCGVVGYHGIMSNNSMNGLWEMTYTDASWHDYYHTRLGFPVFFFKPL